MYSFDPPISFSVSSVFSSEARASGKLQQSPSVIFFTCMALLLAVSSLSATPENLTVNSLQVQSGQSSEQTAKNTVTAETNVDILSGGTADFMSGRRIVLKPGFHAESGSAFLADVDGDGDGLATYWERQYNLNEDSSDFIFTDADGDGLNLLMEFLTDSDPFTANTSTWQSNTAIDDIVTDAVNDGAGDDLLISIPNEGLFLVDEKTDRTDLTLAQ